jgi:hypothetical protein
MSNFNYSEIAILRSINQFVILKAKKIFEDFLKVSKIGYELFNQKNYVKMTPYFGEL